MNQLDENGGCQGFFMKYDDDEFEEFPGMTPSFEIIERELRTLINYGVDFPLESFFRLIRKKFTALFLVSCYSHRHPQVVFTVINDYLARCQRWFWSYHGNHKVD